MIRIKRTKRFRNKSSKTNKPSKIRISGIAVASAPITSIVEGLFGMPDATIPFGPIYANVPDDEDDEEEDE